LYFKHINIALMKITLMKILFFTTLALCCAITSQAQLVWPGDANNNGIVNGVDVLWMGLAYDAHGPVRSNASNEWSAQPIDTPWEQAFSCGLNYAYADADGDGFVDFADVEGAIVPNFRLTHGSTLPDGYTNARYGSASVALTLVPSATVVQPGETVNIKILLGTEQLPVSNFYGIALKMHYTSGLVNNNGSDISFTPHTNWIDLGEQDTVLDLFYKDSVSGDMEVALVRTNQAPVSGHGAIGSFSIIIEDIIVGIAPQFEIRVDSVMLIDQNDTIIAVVPDTVFITINPKVKPRENQPEEALRISPNPSGPDVSAWRLESSEPLDHAELTDGLGRSVTINPQQVGENLWLLAKPQNLPPGAYWLTAFTNKGALQTQRILTY